MPAAKPDPAMVTVSPATSRVDGVTVMVGAGGGGMLPSNWMRAMAEAVVPLSSVPPPILQAPATAQSTAVPPRNRIRCTWMSRVKAPAPPVVA